MRIFLLGLLFFIFLLIGVTSNTPELLLLCSFNNSLGCASVLNSDYSSIFNIPLWVYGLLWSSLVLFRINKKDLLLTTLSYSGAVVSLWSIFTMTFLLKSFCFLCFLADLILLIIFLIHIKPDKIRPRKFFLDFLLSLIVSLASWQAITLITHTEDLETEKITLLSSPLVLGNIHGSKEIVVFLDLQCPACSKAAPFVHKILENKDTKVVLKNFPLSKKCNPSVSNDDHNWACYAARTLYCGFEQGQLLPVYSLIYSAQEQISEEKNILELINDGNINIEEMESCVNGDTSFNMVQNDIFEGIKTNIKGTPTFFFNGQEVKRWNDYRTWERLLK